MAPLGNDYLRGVRKDLFCTFSIYALFIFHKWETTRYVVCLYTNCVYEFFAPIRFHESVSITHNSIQYCIVTHNSLIQVANWISRFDLSKALSLILRIDITAYTHNLFAFINYGKSIMCKYLLNCTKYVFTKNVSNEIRVSNLTFFHVKIS